MRGDHHDGLVVHARLCVLALLEATARDRHDARLVVREVDLIDWTGAHSRRLALLASEFIADLELPLASGTLGFKCLLLYLVAIGRTLLYLAFLPMLGHGA